MQLYINTYGVYLHVKGEMFELLVKDKDGQAQNFQPITDDDKAKVKEAAKEILKIISDFFFKSYQI